MDSRNLTLEIRGGRSGTSGEAFSAELLVFGGFWNMDHGRKHGASRGAFFLFSWGFADFLVIFEVLFAGFFEGF